MSPRRQKNYLAGAWVESDAGEHRIQDKYEGSTLATVALAGSQQMDAAIEAAVAARTTLRGLSAGARASMLEHIGDGIAARHEELAQLLRAEAGKPITLARAEVDRALLTVRAAAAEAIRLTGEVVPVDFAAGEGRTAFSRREPVGVVAAITPFNFPLNLALHKIAPALAVGCPMVLKPAPQAPLVVFALAEIAHDAGIPAGALSVLQCDIPVAEQLVRDARIAMLSFTGSASVGWHLKGLCGRKRVALELGGNAGVVVDESADLELAARRIAFSACAFAGQSCISTQRVFVHAAVAERFEQGLAAEFSALEAGDPAREDVHVGPLIDSVHFERVAGWVEGAVARGARVLAGGDSVDATRNVYAPTLLGGAHADSELHCEEVFGPVAVVERVSSFDEAIARVNDSRYGLQAGVFTSRIDHMRRAHAELEVGAVIVNDSSSFRLDTMPYGGVKQSGLGREGLRYAMEEMTEGRLLVY